MKKLFTFKFNAITNDFNVIIFYHLSGCPKLNFEPLTKRESHTPSVNHCAIFQFDPNITRNLITRLSRVHLWDSNWEPVLIVTRNPTLLLSPAHSHYQKWTASKVFL